MKSTKPPKLHKFLPHLLTLCLALGSVFAAPHPVHASLQTTALTFTTTSSQSGQGFDWNHTTRVLTLTNFNAHTNAAVVLQLPADSTITLVGSNFVSNEGFNFTTETVGIRASSPLTINGNGTLDIRTGNTTHIYNFGVYISSGSPITMNIGGAGHNPTIIARSGNAGTATDTGSVSRGLQAHNLNINSGTIIATGGNTNATNVNNGSSGVGGTTVTMNGGTLISRSAATTGIRNGINTTTAIVINGGFVRASGDNGAFNRQPTISTGYTSVSRTAANGSGLGTRTVDSYPWSSSHGDVVISRGSVFGITGEFNLIGAVSQNGNGIAWNADTRTLTLTNFVHCGTASRVLRLPANSIIVLNGQNTISNSMTNLGNTASYAIHVEGEGSLTIRGTGTLNVISGNNTSDNSPLRFDTRTGTLNIENGTVNLFTGNGTTTYGAIAGNHNITGGTVNVLAGPSTASTYGLFAYTESTTGINISGGHVNAFAGNSTGASNTSAGIMINGGSAPISISGGFVNAVGGTALNSSGLRSGSTGTIHITGGVVTAIGNSQALWSRPGILPLTYHTTTSTNVSGSNPSTPAELQSNINTLRYVRINAVSTRSSMLDFTSSSITWQGGSGNPTAAGADLNALATEGWRWQQSTNTLTLDGLRLQVGSATPNPLRVPANAKIILADGSNNLVSNAGNNYTVGVSGIFSTGGISFEGNGTLNITTGNTNGANNNRGINGNAFTFSSGTYNVSTGAQTGTGEVAGIYSGSTINISGSTIINATGGSAAGNNSNGIHSANNFTVSNSSAVVTATGGTVTSTGLHASRGIRSNTIISIGGGTVTATGGTSSGGGGSIGLNSNGSTYINGGTVNAIAGAISSGTGRSEGMVTGTAVNGISISSGTVTAIGNTRAFNAAPRALPNRFTARFSTNTTDTSSTQLTNTYSYSETHRWARITTITSGSPSTRISPLDFTSDSITHLNSARNGFASFNPTTQSSAASTGEGWSWNIETKTLTLSNINLWANAANLITLPIGSTIVLANGTQNFVRNEGYSFSQAVSGINVTHTSNAPLTIQGSGELNINTGSTNSGENIGIRITTNLNGNHLTINDGTINVKAGASGTGSTSIGIGAAAIIVNNGTVTTEGGSFGLFARADTTGGGVHMNGGTVLAIGNTRASGGVPDSGAFTTIPAFYNATWSLNTSGSSSILGLPTNWADAKWLRLETESPPTFTVIYDGNGADDGIVPVDDNDYIIGEEVTVLGNVGGLSKDGYIFVGWNTEADGSGDDYFEDDTFEIYEDTILYAIWGGKRVVIVDDKTGMNFAISENGMDELFNYFGIEAEDSVIFTLTIDEIGKPDISSAPAPGVVEIMDIAQGRALQFFDITVTKTINNDIPITLPVLPVPIQVVIDLSAELSGRTGYSVYRYHDNEVQLIGMNSTDGEFFTIIRGTSGTGTDQIIINTKRFSTYAVVEHIMALEINEPESFDVQARIIEEKNLVYRIDIEWGAMRFEYVLSEDGESGEWDVQGFDGINNEIKVTNRSNAGVMVSFEVTNNVFERANGEETVVMSIVDEDDVTAPDMQLTRVVFLSGFAVTDNVSVFLILEGNPSQDWISENTPYKYTKVGVITVTIEPDD